MFMPVSALMTCTSRAAIRRGLVTSSMSIALPSAWLLHEPLVCVRGLNAQHLPNGAS